MNYRMLNNWCRQTEEELMENKRKGTPKDPIAIHLFAEALVGNEVTFDAEKQYLYKNQMDFGASKSKEDKENEWLST